MQKNKIIFWGGPEFSLPAFISLYNKGYALCVVTTPDKQSGRKKTLTSPPLKMLAVDHSISILQPDTLKQNDQLLKALKEFKPDLFVVASYGKIIPKEYLAIPVYGSLNIHPSLLPLYRGPTPIQSAILNGETETGVTIMSIDEKMDHGPILKMESVKLKNKNYMELSKELAELGSKLLVEVIPNWIDGNIKPKTQDHSKATFTKKFKFEEGKIDWNKTTQEIDRHIRALNPEPGTWTLWNNKILKLYEAEIRHDKIDKKNPGSVSLDTDIISVHTSNGTLVIKKLKREGKRVMNAQEFIHGHKDFIGSKLN